MTAQTLDDLLQAEVDAVARRYVGLAAAVVVGDDTATYGAGRAAPGAGPPDARTLFPIASVTKVVTALALADAVTRGELTLDTPLGDLLPGVPVHRSGQPITLGHLARHTAGLPAMPRGLLLQGLLHRDDPHGSLTRDDLVAALPTTRLRRAPGGRPRYSNLGAALLAEALCRHSGLPYADLVAQRVTGPLGLDDTVARLRDDQRDRKAVGHARRNRPVPDWTLDGLVGAGGLWSTVADLLTLAGVGVAVLANSARGVERATLDLVPRLARRAGSSPATSH